MFEETLLDRVLRLQNGLIAEATGASFDGGDQEYKKIRSEIANLHQYKALIPDFIRRCSDTAHFWGWIKYECGTYAERRSLIWAAFAPLIEAIEFGSITPISAKTEEYLKIHGQADIHILWQKALGRVPNDPEGAITLARTLLEATCKAILEDLNIPYKSKDSLPQLWTKCSKELNLSPSQHHQEVFKSILGNCASIVSNIGSLRNKLGDAHADQRVPVKPKPKHAELSVNLAGTMAVFITTTWKEKTGP